MIPRIIHQIWIGDLYNPPLELMETWKECAKQLNIEYILWNENEINKRNIVFECQSAIDIIPEINGKVDIMRWEILLKYGGIFIDADSICVELLIEEFFTPQKLLFNKDLLLLKHIGFSAFENEEVRPNLIATGTMGFTINHPLIFDIIDWLKNSTNDILLQLQTQKAWITVGPGCITRFLETKKYKDIIVIFPSHYFIPIHYTPESKNYNGHQKVYAHQLWGTGEQKYNDKLTNKLPIELLPPTINNIINISILINSYNTSIKTIHKCLKSIQNQTGLFMMELIWIDNGSTTPFTNELLIELDWFKRTTRFLIDVKYYKINENIETQTAIDYGLTLCCSDLIIKMDSQDIMISTRIQTQIDYMKKKC